MPTRNRTLTDLQAIRDEVAVRSAEQAYVFRRTDLTAWGIDPEVCPAMLRRQLWTRLRHGVYVDAGYFSSLAADEHARHLVDVAAAVASLDRPAFALGVSAAHVHGLPLPWVHPHVVHLVRELGIDHRALRERLVSSRGLPELRITGHRLAEVATTTVNGIPVVERPLAALTAAAELSHEWAVAVMDAACFRDEAAVQALNDQVNDWPSLRGIGVVRGALPEVRTGAQSPFESISRVRLMDRGLPEPVLQAPFYDADGLIGYADMWWPDLGVIGEADGRIKYQTGTDLLDEKYREDRLRAQGLIVVRWGWDAIMMRPQEVVLQILAAAQWSRARVYGRSG